MATAARPQLDTSAVGSQQPSGSEVRTPRRLSHHASGHTSPRLEQAESSTGIRRTFSSAGLAGARLLGKRIEVFWEGTENGDVWYPGRIVEFDHQKRDYLIQYDDGDRDWYKLNAIKYRVIEEASPAPIVAKGRDSRPPRTFSEIGLTGVALLGKRLKIFWDDPSANGKEQWYPGVIQEYRISDDHHFVQFDDGDTDWYCLDDIKYEMLDVVSPRSPHGNAAGLQQQQQKLSDGSALETVAPGESKSPSPAAVQPHESKGRADEWLAEARQRRQERKKRAMKDPGFEVSGQLSIGGVHALRSVHAAMLQARYSMSESERLKEYWDIQTRCYFTADKSSTQRVDLIGRIRGEVGDRTMPPSTLVSESAAGNDMQARFRQLARLHSELDVADIPGTVPPSNDAESKEGATANGKSEHSSGFEQMRKAVLSADRAGPKKIVEAEEPDADKGAEMEKALLGSATIPVPAMPEVRGQIDHLLETLRQAAVAPDEPGTENQLGDKMIAAFDEQVASEEIIVGTVSLRDIQLQEQKMEATRLEHLRRDVRRYRRREEALVAQEARARARVLKVADDAQEKADQKKVAQLRLISKQERALRRSFRRKESQLQQHLEAQESIVKKRFGKLETRMNTDQLSYSVFKVRWNAVPQPIALDFKAMRAVRDRLPNGRYVILTTLYDRLGGEPLFWSEVGLSGADVGLPGATDPVRHLGRYYDVDLPINGTALTLAPSLRDARPTLTYVFELYQLGTGRYPDRVVAWSAIPAVDIRSQYCTGKFRVPLLRGAVDRSISLYSAFERAYTEDLDRWLCNLYFEVRLESRETILSDGTVLSRKEIEMDFTRQLLSLKNPQEGIDSMDMDMMRDDTGPTPDPSAAPSPRSSQAPQTGLKKGDAHYGGYSAPAARRRKPHNAQKSVGSGQPMDTLNTSLSEFQKRMKGQSKLDVDELHRHSYALAERGAAVQEGNVPEAARRMIFLLYEFADEYKVRRWASLEFWISFMILVGAFYVRIYTHYIGLYIYLKILGIQVYRFELMAYQILTKYPNGAMSVSGELGASVAGHIFNIALFIAQVVIMRMWKRLLGKAPDILSKWLLGFGVGVMLDGVFTFLIDVLLGNHSCASSVLCGANYAGIDCTCMYGDAFKLPEMYIAMEGTSVPGWLIIGSINLALLVLGAILLYNYLLVMHFDGRVWDLYKRLTALEQDMFMPDDLELSTRELRWICSKAARWRGPRGDRRKVGVVEYIMTDPLYPKFKEVTTHLAIFHETSSGKRTLYRHFLRSPDGTLLEVFGDIEKQFRGEFRALEEALVSASKANQGNGQLQQFLESKKQV